MIEKHKKESNGDLNKAYSKIIIKLEKQKTMKYQYEKFKNHQEWIKIKKQKDKFVKNPWALNAKMKHQWEKEVERQKKMQGIVADSI